MMHHPRSFLTVTFTLLALCALPGCLSEEDPAAGDPSLEPTGSGGWGGPTPPVGGMPMPTGGEPSGGAPSGGATGLPSHVGYYHPMTTKVAPTMLWPDGRFATSTPLAGDDGRFDFERTTAKSDPGSYGTYDVAPVPGAGDRLRLSFHYASGVELSEELILRNAGGWQMRKSGHIQVTFPYQGFDGTFTREWSTSVGGLPVGGGSDPELTVGKFVYLEFSPGKRFHYRNTTNVTVTSYIGGQMGGRVYGGTDFLNQVAVNEGGTYRIEDNIYLVLSFDSGAEATGFVRFLPSVMQASGGSTGSFLDWGKHRYACPGSCVIE